MRDAGKQAGCPDEQVERFLKSGILLEPKQMRASAAARLCDEDGGPTQVLYGGARGGGKSHWGMAQVVADDMQRFPGLKFLILRQIGRAAREAVEDLRLRVLGSIRHKWSGDTGILRLENGSRAIVGHFKNERDIDNYLGIEYDGILVEEATTLTSSKRRKIATCCRTSKRGWRPRIYNTTNPGGVGHASIKTQFVEPFRRGIENDTRFIPATVYDNPHVNPDYKATLEVLVGWERRAWLDGDWDIAAGQFFTNFRRDIHVIPAFEIPGSWPKWCSLDYGFTHYTSVHLMTEGDGTLYTIDEHAERRWLPEQHAAGIKAMLERNGLTPRQLRRFVAGADVFSKDRSGTTTADEYAKHGIHLTAANIDRINGASEILRRLGNSESDPVIPSRAFIFDRCARLVDSLPALEHDPHRPEDVLKVDVDEDGSGGDDFYDSFRYGAMEATRRSAVVHIPQVAAVSGGWARG